MTRSSAFRAADASVARTAASALGLHRVVVPTRLGAVVVRTGRPDLTAAPADRVATVLLHGAAGTWTTWIPLLETADAAAHPLHDVIALDLPGWGASGDVTRAHEVEDMSDAVADAARALGYSRWTLVGHSLGGFVALDIAARYRAETRGVVLVSASGSAVIDAIRRPLRGGARLPGFAGMLALMRALAALGPLGRAFVSGITRLGMMPLLTSPLFAGRVDRPVADAFADEIRPASFAHAARLAGVYEPRAWGAIACPVRAVRGVRDVFAGEDDAGMFTRLIRDFHEVRLADAGHFANLERPDAVLDALERVGAACGGPGARHPDLGQSHESRTSTPESSEIPPILRESATPAGR